MDFFIVERGDEREKKAKSENFLSFLFSFFFFGLVSSSKGDSFSLSLLTDTAKIGIEW